MLTSLLINNVVLIEKLELKFSKGLTIFSGETGAGKSVLLDSLALVSGMRGDVGLIRTGADKLAVTATFEIQNKKSALFEIFKENDIDGTDEVIIRRVLSADGKSKIFLNDTPISLKLLKTISAYLLEIHGQFDNQGLLDNSTHIDFLDSFGDYKAVLDQTAKSFENLKNLQKKLKEAIAISEKNARDEELLSHYATELENIHTFKGEEKELTNKRLEMMNASKLIENLNGAYQAINGQSWAQNIRHALGCLDKANKLTENKYENILSILDSALVEIDEASREIESAVENISLNANTQEEAEERFLALKALARKHGCAIDDLPDVLEDILQKLKNIHQASDDIIAFQKELTGAKDAYFQSALKLHECRLAAAEKLSKCVQSELCFLKMNQAEFRVQIEKLSEENWNEKGIDKVFFEAATNAGQPFGMLSKIASGGELARFMLAIKVHLAAKAGIETLIFDEIDSGIGGSAAEAVGSRLCKLSNDVQVMAVTHSPQVASFGTTNFKVSKEITGNTTTSKVMLLTDIQKKEEIARMLSGEKISDEARAAADKLMTKSA